MCTHIHIYIYMYIYIYVYILHLPGAPMSAVGSYFEDTSCWSERRNRRFSWASSPAERPPRLVPM